MEVAFTHSKCPMHLPATTNCTLEQRSYFPSSYELPLWGLTCRTIFHSSENSRHSKIQQVAAQVRWGIEQLQGLLPSFMINAFSFSTKNVGQMTLSSMGLYALKNPHELPSISTCLSIKDTFVGLSQLGITLGNVARYTLTEASPTQVRPDGLAMERMYREPFKDIEIAQNLLQLGLKNTMPSMSRRIFFPYARCLNQVVASPFYSFVALVGLGYGNQLLNLIGYAAKTKLGSNEASRVVKLGEAQNNLKTWTEKLEALMKVFIKNEQSVCQDEGEYDFIDDLEFAMERTSAFSLKHASQIPYAMYELLNYLNLDPPSLQCLSQANLLLKDNRREAYKILVSFKRELGLKEVFIPIMNRLYEEIQNQNKHNATILDALYLAFNKKVDISKQDVKDFFVYFYLSYLRSKRPTSDSCTLDEKKAYLNLVTWFPSNDDCLGSFFNEAYEKKNLPSFSGSSSEFTDEFNFCVENRDFPSTTWDKEVFFSKDSTHLILKTFQKMGYILELDIENLKNEHVYETGLKLMEDVFSRFQAANPKYELLDHWIEFLRDYQVEPLKN